MLEPWHSSLTSSSRRAAEQAPAVAVAVDRQLAVAAQMVEPGQADRVEADHDAGAPGRQHPVVFLGRGCVMGEAGWPPLPGPEASPVAAGRAGW